MSGLAVLFERTGAPASADLLGRIMTLQVHRGPDRVARHIAGSIALGHGLLETTPEDTSDVQPRRSPSGRNLWIISDARLDNREDLLLAMRRKADTHQEIPDSALLLWAYERWGAECTKHLLGDFAFAIWDGDAGVLFCARDHIGIKPLYFNCDAKGFRCASEPAALLADPRVDRRPNELAIGLYLIGWYAERDETLWMGIRALPPAHSLTVSAGDLRVEAYWQPIPPEPMHGSDQHFAEFFHAVLEESVRCRLRARRSIVADVSGGLDSSSVATLASELLRRGEGSVDLSFTRCTFPGLPCDEQLYSDAVAARCKRAIASVDMMKDPDICCPEQRNADIYFHPTLTMLDATLASGEARGARTIFTGVGGDQMMRPTDGDIASALLTGDFAEVVARAGILRAPTSLTSWRRLAGQALLAFGPAAALGILRRRRRPHAWPHLGDRLREQVREFVAAADVRQRRLHAHPSLQDLCDALMHSGGLGLPLAVLDRASARAGMELRHPFLDVRVLEFLLAVPQRQRFWTDQSKRVLRNAMVDALPPIVRRRKDKSEFGSFVYRCFLERHRGKLRNIFRNGRLADLGLICTDEVRKSIEARTDATLFPLVSLTAMELWASSQISN